MASNPALEAAESVYAADQAVQRAGRSVEDLHATINSALRILDDAELDSAKARLSDRRNFYLEAAAEHMGRLQSRCCEMAEMTSELDTYLDRASQHVQDSGNLISELDTDPQGAAVASRLQLRVVMLGEIVALARPMAMEASRHVEGARTASLDVVLPTLLEPQLLERSIRSGALKLGRAEENVRLLELVLNRAALTARQSASLASEISDNAQPRVTDHRRDQDPGATVPSQRPGRPAR